MDARLLHVLLPHLDAVVVDEVAADRGVIRVRARTRPETACRCPDCGTPSARAHSHYERHLADTAIGGRPVAIGLSARRLFCDNAACPRHSFAEQVEGLTIRYGLRAPGLVRVVRAVALALAGRAGGPGSPAPGVRRRPTRSWLFDGETVLFNLFAGDGTMTGEELVTEPKTVAMCTVAFEAVWQRAVPHEDYHPR